MVRRRRGPSFGIVVFRYAYWALVVVVGVALWFYVPDKQSDLAFNQLTIFLYAIAAGAVYRLILLFALHAGGSDAVEREIRESEGRVELKLDDRDDGWGA
jgi:hypothetical protein